MTQWELPNELRPVLKRLAWFEPLRSEAAFDPNLFLQLAMAYASQSELDQIRQHFPVEEFRTALRQAPPGLFDRQSWRYWHQALGLGKPARYRNGRSCPTTGSRMIASPNA